MSKICAVVLMLGALLAGCASPKRTPTTQATGRVTAEPAFWLDQPATQYVIGDDFDRMWNAAADTAREYGFRLDREDYRGGVLTTQALVSKQFFELWRHDIATLRDQTNSTLATYRRTLRFEFSKRDDGYDVAPKVVIERYAQAEQPITSTVYTRSALNTRRRDQVVSTGTPESDRGIILPQRYWYATGRDQALEANVAKSLKQKLRSS